MSLKFGWKATIQTRWTGEQQLRSHRFYDDEDEALRHAIDVMGGTDPGVIRTYAVEYTEPLWDDQPITTYHIPARIPA